MNIGLAKDKVLELSKNCISKSFRNDIQVLGRAGISVLYSAINEFRLGEYMSITMLKLQENCKCNLWWNLTGSQRLVRNTY